MALKLRVVSLAFLFVSSFLQAQDRLDLQLLDAVKENNIPLAKQLLEQGADINFKDSNNTPLVMWAAYRAGQEMLAFLIENGADYKQRGIIYIDGERNAFYGHLLGIAAGSGNLGLVKYIVEELKVDVNEVEYQPDHAESGWTALDWAAYRQHDRVFDYLTEQGARVRMDTYTSVDNMIRRGAGLRSLEKIDKINAIAKDQGFFTDSVRAYTMILKGRGLIGLRSIEAGLDSLRQALAIADKKGDTHTELAGEALRYMAFGFSRDFQYDSAIHYYRDYFQKVPLASETVNNAQFKALAYLNLKRAYSRAGRLDEWQQVDLSYHEEMENAAPALYSIFYFTYARLLRDGEARDESMKMFRKVLRLDHEDNEYIAFAGYYLIQMMAENLDKSEDLIQVVEAVKRFGEKYPKYSKDYSFVSNKNNAEIRIGRILVQERKTKQAILQFEDAVKSSLTFLLADDFEFYSPLKKRLFGTLNVSQDFYSVLVGYEPDPSKERLRTIIANELVEGIIDSDKVARFSELARYDVTNYSSGLYNELRKSLGKNEALVLTCYNKEVEGRYPPSVIYLVTPKSDSPIMIPVRNYSGISKINNSRESIETRMKQMYLALWDKVQEELPKKVEKIYFKGAGSIKGGDVGNFINPDTSTRLSETYEIESISRISDILK